MSDPDTKETTQLDDMRACAGEWAEQANKLLAENSRLEKWIAAAIEDLEKGHSGQALVSLMTAQEGRTMNERPDRTETTEPPCIGLDPDTDPCPFCKAWLSDACMWPLADHPISTGDDAALGINATKGTSECNRSL